MVKNLVITTANMLSFNTSLYAYLSIVILKFIPNTYLYHYLTDKNILAEDEYVLQETDII